MVELARIFENKDLNSYMWPPPFNGNCCCKLAINKSKEQKQEEYKNAKRDTHNNCLPIGFKDMLLSGTKNIDSKKRKTDRSL